MSEVTQLLHAISQGDRDATSRLLPLVYQELRHIARGHMVHERQDHTLQATALVHEAYLRLVGDDSRWDNRGHFFSAAAEAMRRILIDHARRKHAVKRGGAAQQVELDEDLLPIAAPCDQLGDLLSLNDALQRFEATYPDKAELVKLLFFAGLSLDEAAAARGVGRTTAYRHWVFARAWLVDAMGGRADEPVISAEWNESP